MTTTSRPNCLDAKVIIVDATRMGCESLGAKLKKDHCSVLYAGTSLKDAESELPRADVVLVSGTLNGDPDAGYVFSSHIRRVHPHVHVVILVDRSDFNSVVRSFRSGARGIFGRDGPLELLSKCINRVRQGQVWASSEELQHLLEALSAPPRMRLVDSVGIEILAPREQEVVHWVAQGLTNREIADQLGLSANTVKNYLFRIFDKLGISNRVELILYVATQTAPQRSIGSGVAVYSPSVAESSPEFESWRDSIAELALPQHILGEMYRDGRNVQQNKIKALMWFILAESVCLDFSERSTRNRAHLELQLLPHEVELARRLAQDIIERRKRVRVDAEDIEDQLPSAG